MVPNMEVTMEIEIGKGCDRTITVPDIDYARVGKAIGLTPQMVEYIWDNGWTQSLNDAHSSIKKSDPAFSVDTVWSLANKKFDAIMSGTARIQSSRTRDEVKAEAIRLAMDRVRDRIKDERKRIDSKYYGQDMPSEKVIREKALPYVGAFMEQAAAVVAARAPAVEIDVEI